MLLNKLETSQYRKQDNDAPHTKHLIRKKLRLYNFNI